MSDALHRFSHHSLPVTPWKNGGGSTCEILSWPPDSGIDGFDWRVSIATIDADGPFSTFEGVNRIIVLLEGDGVRLHAPADAIDHRLDRPHAPFAFRGDSPVDCALLGGPSTDFNVMCRRAQGRVEVLLIDLADGAPLPPAHGGLLMSLHGCWRVGDDLLDVGHGVWWADANVPRPWPAMQAVEARNAASRLIAVRWTPTASAHQADLHRPPWKNKKQDQP